MNLTKLLSGPCRKRSFFGVHKSINPNDIKKVNEMFGDIVEKKNNAVDISIQECVKNLKKTEDSLRANNITDMTIEITVSIGIMQLRISKHVNNTE